MIGEHHRLEGAGLTVLVAVSVHEYNYVAAPGVVLTILLAVRQAHEVILLKL